VWQGLYEELKDRNFLIVSVAFDAGGPTAVKDWIRPATPAQLPKEVLDIMGWEETLSSKAAMPTYPCLIDEKHIVAERYNIVNVPTAVWINESGRIVRPAEPAGATDGFRRMDRAARRMPAEVAAAGKQARKRYIDAIRDWVEKGDASVYALSPGEVRRRVHGRTEHEALADANFRLGQYLYQQGHRQAAQRYFAEAKRLDPENWRIKRQSLELEESGKAFGPEFWAAVDALGEKSYYPPVNL
jgi:tetratricopeptide (TPR) repeat protein